ncbi:MAG TPA: thioredoxin domain-containing protein [Thiobacillaceae bacterium]|nr:thioredoxin domain-containing protein [Thiobacillaceae bacterium]HNU63346.1 thioredoxin domain-containing protein [Thiobacillaceae bacterium]
MTLQHHDHQHTIGVGDRLIFDTDLHHFDIDVLEASRHHLVLVDLWADWCGPCHFLAPVLERVIPAYAGRVRLAKVEVDEGDNMKLAGRYGARGFPTVLLFKDGEEKDRFHSARPEHFVRRFIDAHLG